MSRLATLAFCCVLLPATAACSATRVVGVVTRVTDHEITASFPVPVYPQSMMIIQAGDGEAVAGTAIVQKCTGEAPPYDVTAELLWASDPLGLAAGKKAYVNSINAAPAPSHAPRAAILPGARVPSVGDLRLHYFAAGQTIGYGAVGLGYEHSIRLVSGLSVKLDAGVAGLPQVAAVEPNKVSSNQSVMNVDARVDLAFGPRFGVYSGGRWLQAKGDDDRWATLRKRLRGRSIVADSELDSGTVRAMGIEYGVQLSPNRKFAFSAGYIPSYWVDYGSFGVCTAPAYTSELRFALGPHIVRLRGLSTDGYWTGDIGIAIR